MIKRNESNSGSAGRKSSARKRDARRQKSLAGKRRLNMESLEARQLLAVLTEPPIQPAPTDLPTFDQANNVGAVAAFSYSELEASDTVGTNDFRTNAEFIPLGTAPGKEPFIDVTGSMPITTSQQSNSGFSADLDTYAFDLRAGDILDVSTIGAAGQFTIRTATGGVVLTSATPAIPLTGTAFPRQVLGNANGTTVIPEDGRYFLTVGSASQLTTYTIGLRTYRPVTESLAFGDAQILYLDWEGGVVDNNLFNNDLLVPGLPTNGFTVIPTFEESLPLLGLEFGDLARANQIAQGVYDDVVRIYEDLTRTGTNGDFEVSGIGGDYAVRILSSRIPEHRQWFLSNSQDPRMTRMLIGGTGLDIGVPGVFGTAGYVDIGNFDLSDFAVFALDGFQGAGLGFPIAAGASQIDVTTQFLASVVAHEAAHNFGMRHTVNTNTINTLSDAGGGNAVAQGLGVGPDGIFGTLDDIPPVFNDDFYEPLEGFSGFNRVTANLTHALSAGTTGGAGLSGTVFSDVNRNGVNNSNEPGLAGVSVFADIDGDGQRDSSEPQAVTNASGGFTLVTPPGTFPVIAETPTGFSPTTATSVSSSSGSISFGFNQVNANITGATYVDTDGDGVRDGNEGGLADIYLYIDLDQDNRPDLGEPSTRSGADGSYSLNFPGPGTYTIRQAIPPGFEQTFPAAGEHIVTFTGGTLNGNFDFGLLPSSDFGDAPDSYSTLAASNGPSHGIVAGLQLGNLVDREINGVPSTNALGDDNSQADDEDGVRLLSPLGRGDTAQFEVNVTNTVGTTAFLQAFLDFNRDGDFLDAGEQVVTDLPIANGTVGQNFTVGVDVPASAELGATFARFRLSQLPGIGATGFAATGEVEDHAFTILQGANVAVDDPSVGAEAAFTVSQNSIANTLDVLANDFDTATNPLTIDTLDLTGTQGILGLAADGRSISYTPPLNFVGIDTFQYRVRDSLNNVSNFATVTVTVSFQSDRPIAVDDSFQIPEGSVNRPLNVLNNDIPSTSGGLSIVSVDATSGGGTVQIVGGGQSLRYTPLPGFDGTDQFIYRVRDGDNQISEAEVTINVLPGSANDDVVAFSFGTFDPVNPNTPVETVRVGDEFLLRVSVEDLSFLPNPEGVASAFLDVLYSSELVSVVNSTGGTFPFDITFGPLFSGGNSLGQASATTPGLIDEVGAARPFDDTPHTGPTELFTIRMTANAPGIAQFVGDPADALVSDTVLLSSDVELLDRQLRFGSTDLTILPFNQNFTSAIDDSFADTRDSNGILISSASTQRNVLDVLNNDNLGPTGQINQFILVTNPAFGNVFIDPNGTPEDLNDDFLSYRPNVGANGLEQFTYLIVTDDGVSSRAEVTIPLGNTNANAEVAFDFELVDTAGNPITSVNVGDTFGVRIDTEDLRPLGSFVFAGYLDVLYDSGLIRPVDGVPGTEFDFTVSFGPQYETDAAVGTAARLGIIDEFGSVFERSLDPNNGQDPAELATIFFEAIGVGQAVVVGSPADSSPFQDTLLFGEDDPVTVDRIRYDRFVFNIGAGTVAEGEAIQNPTLAQDVNNDGVVSPIDALLIINNMSRLSSAEGEQAPLASQYYLDVNGDRKASAIDALQVINYLSRRANSEALGEGENLAPLSTSDSEGPQSVADTNDALFADLSSTSKLVDVSSSKDAALTTVASQTGGDTADDDEAEDSDVLDLLADDVSGIWG